MDALDNRNHRRKICATQGGWANKVSINRSPGIKLFSEALSNVKVNLFKAGTMKEETGIGLKTDNVREQESINCTMNSQVADLRNFIRSSGIYALSSLATPFISLTLAPFLTHTLSPADYGILTLLNSVISLLAGISQLGLGSAFFRVYNYDYTQSDDKRDVAATTIALLFGASLLAAVVLLLLSSFLAEHLLGRSSHSDLIVISGGVLIAQNLAIAGFVWLRAENRAFFFSCMSIGNMLVTLLANIILVGGLRWGIRGSLISIGAGQLCVILCTLPLIASQLGIRIRIRGDIARDLLTFGVPLIFGFISTWILQLSDRYLLSHFSSLEETANYAVAYTLGSAISIVTIGPFALAWPTVMFTIAKRNDATAIYQRVFRYFSLLLLLANFGLSCLGIIVLYVLFPVSYHRMAFVIPLVSTSIMFYGTCHIFMIGANIKRKTWVSSVFITIGALVNILLNILLIPRYGAAGAAISTLVAYIVIAVSAYQVNQKLYPIPFEIGRFVVALVPGIILYAGSSFVASRLRIYEASGVYAGALALYTSLIVMLGGLPIRRLLSLSKSRSYRSLVGHFFSSKRSFAAPAGEAISKSVCMHVRGTVRVDVRVLREATALLKEGWSVSIIDVEADITCPAKENTAGIQIYHLFCAGSRLRTKFKLRLFVASIYRLLRTKVAVYHAHDISALPACYLAACLRRRPLIFDAHELPFAGPDPHWDRLSPLFKFALRHILSRCAGVITVSPHIGQEIQRRYHARNVLIVRNVPSYQKSIKTDRLRQHLGLKPGVRIVLYQGNIQSDRRLDVLIHAACFLVPETVIVMMGRADGAEHKRLATLIECEGVGGCVKILPPVPYEDLLTWTSSADIGLIVYTPDSSLNVRWCLPNKFFEYLMAGLPVLASPLDDIEDILHQYDAGRIVPTLAPVDIATAINEMLSDPHALAYMRFNALKAVQEELCWERERYKLVQLYQNIVGIEGVIESDLVVSRS
jgi:O-antigen/teichoic acid export membrane protein/glycosyltransferase involved in cell wall biosynthesis